MKRRQFIQTTAAGTAGLMLVNPLTSLASGGRTIENLGYISGLIGKELDGNWKKVLKQTADMGYTEIETGSYKGKSAEKFLKYCNEIGLKPIAGHLGFTDDKDKIKENLDRLKALEIQYSINYWPYRSGPPFDLDECKHSAEWCNMAGELSKEWGLKFCWHNHDNEYIEMEEGTPMAYIMDNTDPDLVFLELDVHWVHRGGANPVEEMKKYAGRIPILHMKDMSFEVEPGDSFRWPGEGDIDFQAILIEAHEQGIKHFFVERDSHPNGMECLKVSADYLLNLKY